VLLAVIAMTVIGTMSMFGNHMSAIWAIVDNTLP
jgi:Flp pilus assembly pilin Flp